MTARNAMLVPFVLIAASLLGCPSPPPDWYDCWCTDAAGNKSWQRQDGPCENQPMGSGLICKPLHADGSFQAGTGGADGGGGMDGGHH